ncbi:hypothetical protein G3M48_005250 [Beauveria asiatica]|uniref:Uncharacterized protein n=1 Tax=Beauveria asiatica TaxID=1069075 RepID=A0AAW0RRY8_9HYPO
MYKYRSSSSSLGRGKYENRRSVNFVKIKSILLIWAAQLLEEDMYSEYANPPHKASAKEKVDGPPIALTNTNTTSVGNKVYQDNQRFYDVRGSSRNVWEPDVEDPFNHTGSFTPSTEPVIANLFGRELQSHGDMHQSRPRLFCSWPE